VTLYSAGDCSGNIMFQAYGNLPELFGSSNSSVDECSFGMKLSCSANDVTSGVDQPYVMQRYDMIDFNVCKS